ncbi:hypothetical protein LTR10_022396 [Elasticomyces elasticus]|uniref:BZIP domain-containing protein n=1 Tax=Exophiala sideris TaxID=1016849 RepID=A0ABR0IYV6_9EURO|nr:hypothetical protein LTR10_022396 [Elasticomyces elasticus]KAK5022619.1 hypothetical protein LTS07_009842 [Exophiala sideris]KAK5027717.1 hypothetical protein LTR13_009424 [Exophiala sideris]KAK5052195.1 hypothetical protein LTR69_009957 [Exophiala sideris]KAK5178008.1 hypothetical protein LTR44_009557 [Eurotiomycetes sp. CCFEE 6388]
MQHSDQPINTLYSSATLPDLYSYDWSYVPTVFAESNSDEFLDFLLLDDSSTTAMPQETHHRAASVTESVISDTSSTTTQQTIFSESYFQPVPSSKESQPSSAMSGRGMLIPGLPTEQERSHRRREQNRKAQSVFRQKRKCEVSKLQQEVAQLRRQLAVTHLNAATAGWTICAKCRNFYPPTFHNQEASPVSLERESHPDSAWTGPGMVIGDV